ncbi:MAG: hypothetical protein LBK58_11195 [Prevotellaceae bacterium]|jgi:hypothetical protein|nr:hypothetical protein [Prevotellaceae bacterium]
MKRNFLMMAFVSLFTVVALCSCNKDEDENDDKGGNGVIQNNTVTAVVENGASYNSKIDLVEAVTYSNDDKLITLASAPYTNGGFTLNLPASLGAQYLEPLFDEEDEIPDGVTVSNPNVKTGEAILDAYKSDSYVGSFYHGNGDWEGELIYVDGDVSISGSGTETWTYGEGTEYEETYTNTYRYNCNLRKGWNIMYEKRTEKDSYEYTTQAPANVKWYFEDKSSYNLSGSLHKQVSPLSAKQKLRFLSEAGFSGLED